MLDLIRKNASSFFVKGILIFVIGAFIGTIGLIWGAGGFSGLQKEDMAVRVNNRKISMATYRQELQNKINFYRNVYGDRFSSDMIKNFRLDEKTLEELIQKELLLEWATALGFQITDDDVRKRIFSYAMFQQDGIFNASLYRQLLRSNRLSPAAFEHKQREEILLTKAQNLIADRVKVSEQELLLEYQRQNEKISAQYLVFAPQQYVDQVTVEDDRVSSYFEEHQEEYRVAEQRRVEYLWIDVESMEDVTLEEEEFEDYYYEHQDQYLIPAQVQARHILIKVPPDAKPEMEQKAKEKAQDIRQQLETGANFAELAAKFSADKATAVKGGDLGYFSRGRMMPAFEQAAFSLAKGELSQPVKTDYGYHIIGVTDIKPEQEKSLEEVRPQIEIALRKEINWERAQELADTLYTRLLDDKDLQKVAQNQSLEIKQTEFFSLGEEIPELGILPQFSTTAFGLNLEDISLPVRLPEGYALLKLLEVKPSYIPALKDVQEEVKQALIRQESAQLAKAQAEKARAAFQTNTPLEKVAKSHGLEVMDSGDFSRQGVIKGIGPLRDWTAKLFTLKPGEVSPVLERENDNKYYLMVIKEVQAIDQDKFQLEKQELALMLKRQKANQILSDWINGLMENADIEINPALVSANLP